MSVCLHRAAAEIHRDMVRNPSLCVCGCIEQMLRQTNHVRSFKPERLGKVLSLQTESQCQGAPETVEDLLRGLHCQSGIRELHWNHKARIWLHRARGLPRSRSEARRPVESVGEHTDTLSLPLSLSFGLCRSPRSRCHLISRQTTDSTKLTNQKEQVMTITTFASCHCWCGWASSLWIWTWT